MGSTLASAKILLSSSPKKRKIPSDENEKREREREYSEEHGALEKMKFKK